MGAEAGREKKYVVMSIKKAVLARLPETGQEHQ